MERLLARHWHQLPAEEVTRLLDSDLQHGLDALEVQQRQQLFGLNVLTPRRGKGPLLRFILQFHQPLVYILLTAGAVTAALGEWVDSGVIFGVVLVNAVVGFIQESKAATAIAALARTMRSEATVLRGGEAHRVDSTQIVPGDIVLLQSGDKAPADLRLVHVRDLQADESALTGESVPVDKKTDPLDARAVLADRRNMAYASTLVTYGQAKGVVVATGDKTEVGRISQLISQAEQLETPLTRKISRFSHVLLYVILALAGLTFVIGLLRGQDMVDVFMAAVALAVGAIPEGLPAAVTIILAIGVSRMATRRAIIRRLPAVETLGSTTVICSDKTGTLTENQMTVRHIVIGNQKYELSGVGYGGEGQILLDADPVNLVHSHGLLECVRCGVLCNDSLVVEKEGRWTVEGDPTEGALIVAAAKAGLKRDEEWEQWPRLDSVPFESHHQYMATLHDAGEGEPGLVYAKGAVERMLDKCADAIDASGRIVPLDRQRVLREAESLASRGLRVLGFARGQMPAGTKQLNHSDVASGLTFLGVQGMIDPPRPEAIEAVRACRNAGISVKMITGDHAMTASAIARELRLSGDDDSSVNAAPRALTGRDLTDLPADQLIDAAEQVSVFARVSPEQKLRLVQALQARGHVVAMTGDGVNDAPALKQANIGVAMGVGGTEVAKEASDMVLTDDNFATIKAAVEEGRAVFDNLVKFIVWTLPTNAGEGLVILAAIAAGSALPILPAQILWINMTTALMLGMMLAFEPMETDVMNRPPRRPSQPILTGPLIVRIVLVAVIMLIGAFSLFHYELRGGRSIAEATTVAVNLFVFIEMFYLFNCRSLTKNMFQLGLFTNRWLIGGAAGMIGLQMLFTYTPLLNRWFHSAPIRPAVWAGILGFAAITYAIVGVEKWLRRIASARG